MTKLCPRGKAAAKRKFRVYPSAYANAYASKICAGKIKDPSGVKRKDFKGRKPAQDGGSIGIGPFSRRKTFRELKEPVRIPIMGAKTKAGENARKMFNLKMKQFEKLKELKKNQKRTRPKKMMGGGPIKESLKPGVKRTRLEEGRPPKGGPIYKDKKGMTPIPDKKLKRKERAGGGLMEATARLKRQGLKGGGMSSRGLGRAFMKGGRV